MSGEKGREEREDLVVERHPDAGVFLERAQGFLIRNEAENVLMLGLASGRPEDALLLTVERKRELVPAIGAQFDRVTRARERRRSACRSSDGGRYLTAGSYRSGRGRWQVL